MPVSREFMATYDERLTGSEKPLNTQHLLAVNADIERSSLILPQGSDRTTLNKFVYRSIDIDSGL